MPTNGQNYKNFYWSGLSHRGETGKDEKTIQQKGQTQKKKGRKEDRKIYEQVSVGPNTTSCTS